MRRFRVTGGGPGDATAQRWIALLLIFRALAAGTAATLLAVHRVTDHDPQLIVVVSVYAAATTLLLLHTPAARGDVRFWAFDVLTVYALIWFSGDWRSPFYLLALTTLGLPAAWLGLRRAVALGAAWAAAFLLAGHVIGPDPLELGTQPSIETLAIHLVLPVLVCLGIGYAATTFRRLESERGARERLAIEAERRRIAWELHDSAKQRVHAAHLLISSIAPPFDAAQELIRLAAKELQSAAADMDTSLAELRSPLEGRPLRDALRERAHELTAGGGPTIDVRGDVGALPPLQAAHAYRIAGEAMANAVRHADAGTIVVDLAREDGHARIAVHDDGRGMPAEPRPGSTGLLAMRSRTRTIDGALRVLPRTDGPGTTVELQFPIDPMHDEQET